MTRRVSGALLAALLLGIAGANAQDDVGESPRGAASQATLERLEEAESHLASGDDMAALEALEEAIYALSAEMDLAVRAVEIVESAEAYGQYALRENNVFASSDTVTLYVEPLGYSYSQEGDEYAITLDGDFEMRTPGGQIIVAQEDFARFAFEGTRRNREFYLTINYAFRNLRPGEYILVTTLRDEAGGKRTAFETEIVIEGGPDAEADAPAEVPEADAPNGALGEDVDEPEDRDDMPTDRPDAPEEGPAG